MCAFDRPAYARVDVSGMATDEYRGYTREMEETNSIYGDQLSKLEEVRERLTGEIQLVREKMCNELGMDPVEHCLSRIKSEESMREKCRRKGLPETTESALEKIHDAIGIRVVCSFLSDVYVIRDHLAALPNVEVLEEKDYIRHAKPNGYRSYHMILSMPLRFLGNSEEHVWLEIQIRTIAMDCWASIEHQLKYKQNIPNQAFLVQELKRCADEITSTDLSLQTIRDLIEHQENDIEDIE